MSLPRLRNNVPPISEVEIEKKAYEIWEGQKAKGLQSSDAENWNQAKRLLEQERFNQRFFGLGRFWTDTKLEIKTGWKVIQQPFILSEKYVIEPLANLLDRADIFRIVEKLSPVLEAAGVIMIPVVIWWITDSGQKAKEYTDKVERAQKEQSDKVERTQKEQSDKETRAQDAVKIYLNQLSTVFLDGNLEKDERLRTVTRASTLALLNDPNLDGDRKGQVIEYLTELKLIQSEEGDLKKGEEPPKKAVISLASSNLRGADLSRADLSRADLNRADLNGADLNGADLSGADLREALLSGANLIKADLREANLREANLIEADLGEADLSGANLNRANLNRARLFKADLSGADLREAALFEANLWRADFSRTDLSRTDLREAYLCETKLPPNIKLDPDRDCKKRGITS